MKRLLMIVLLIGFNNLFLLGQDDFFSRLAEKADELTHQGVTYDPSYFRINYPNGGVPANNGVCTDVIIRAYRLMGIDLQKEVHVDMAANFHVYSNHWGLKRTDTNIDHRRVPNLMTFFSRKGTVLSKSLEPKDYQPGDIVAWDLGNGYQHIGMVVNHKNSGGRLMVVHNIGNGQILEDCLFSWKIIGHYRYSK